MDSSRFTVDISSICNAFYHLICRYRVYFTIFELISTINCELSVFSYTNGEN